MQLREINRNEIIEHKKRLEKHKRVIDSDVKEVTTQEKTTNENLVVKKKATKKKVIDKKSVEKKVIDKKSVEKKVIDKKSVEKKQQITAEKTMDDVRKEKIDIEKNFLEEEPQKPNVSITKEERAERFKRLHIIAQDVMNKWNE